MRRSLLSASFLVAAGLLSGCSGVDTFFSDSHGFIWNPNRPIGDSENMRRVKGLKSDVTALKPEDGNVWPGPEAPEPTLQDLERQQNALGTSGAATVPAPFVPDHQQPRPGVGGTTPLYSVPNALPGIGTPPPPASSVPGTGPQGTIRPTPRGPAVGTRGPGATAPASAGSNGNIVVPNGNGTSTVIAPDGSISTVPTPK